MKALWPFAKTFLLELHHISHWYGWGNNKQIILSDINLSIGHNKIITIAGPSGSGKTTLLRIMAGLQRPRKGHVFFGHGRQNFLPDFLVSYFRSRYIGFVFQDYRLLSDYTVKENILFALYFSHKYDRKHRLWLQELSQKLGIRKLLHRHPLKLSGGERQRVAIARALVSRPLLLVADEPTGNLDQENGQNVMSILSHLQQELKHTLLIVTHDSNLAGLGDEQYFLKQGQLFSAKRSLV